MRKRIVSIFLIVGLLAGVFSVGAAAASHPFTDVKSGAWYAGSVQYVYDNGLMFGTAPTTFSPETRMNRAMLVAVLYRMDGSKAVSGSTPFQDVNTQDYYYPALQWAYQNSITSGTSDTTFSPGAAISREMMVAIFYRYAEYLGLDVSQLAGLSKYTDAGKISGYAVTAFQWAVQAGIIAGDTPTTLNPKGTATRAECAAILERFAKWAETNTAVEPEPTEPEETTPATEPEETTPSTEPEPTEPEETEPVHTHSYTAKVTKEATCTEAGVKTYTCSCGDSYTEKIPATGHSYTAKVTKEATCTEQGYTTHTCTRCGDSYTEAIPATGHKIDYPPEVICPATCTEDGYVIFPCLICGYDYKNIIPATGHSWEVVHHDEVGHWVTAIKCWCGWTIEGSESKYGVDENGMYHLCEDYIDHTANYSVDEWLSEHGSYSDASYYVVDIPSYDTWVCSVCGEVSDVEP